MNILYVVHQFLPQHAAGTEIYTCYLAGELQRRGHRVAVYTTEIRPDRPQYELGKRNFDGLEIFEAVHNHHFATFRSHYIDERQEENFRRVLDETRPDLVHFQHLHLHSLGYIDEAKRRGLPIVYTLHEYILMCLRGGQFLRPDGGLCEMPEPSRCAVCAAEFLPPPEAKPMPPPGRLGVLLKRLLGRGSRRRAPAGVAQRTGDDASGVLAAYEAGVAERLAEVRRRLVKVDLFVSPSAFLRNLFVENGFIAPERILHSDNGFKVENFHGAERRPAKRLRVGYVGTIAPYKGVHLLVEAFQGLADLPVEGLVYGDLDAFPDYRAQLEAMERPPNLRFMGRFDNARIGEVLAGLDVLVVPSLWFENSPLTIHEAFLARLPVITADRGGMAELVRDGVDGLHFRLGDARDLEAKIRRFVEDAELRSRLGREPPHVKTIQEDADLMEERYRLLLAGRLPAR